MKIVVNQDGTCTTTGATGNANAYSSAKVVYHGGPIGCFTGEEVEEMRTLMTRAVKTRKRMAAARYILLRYGEAIATMPADERAALFILIGMPRHAEQMRRDMLALARFLDEMGDEL